MIRIIHWCLGHLLKEKTPASIAWALLPGFILGVFPIHSIQWWVALLGAVVFRVNALMLIVGALLFSFMTHFLDPMAHNIGDYLLTRNALLKPIWPRLFHAPIIPFTLFNHTVVMGYLTFLLPLQLLCIFISKFIESYSDDILFAVWRSQSWQSFASSRFYRNFSQYLRYENR